MQYSPTRCRNLSKKKKNTCGSEGLSISNRRDVGEPATFGTHRRSNSGDNSAQTKKKHEHQWKYKRTKKGSATTRPVNKRGDCNVDAMDESMR